MRLLDRIVQSVQPLTVEQHDGSTWRLTAAADYAAALGRCPLRYVLQDDLVAYCTQLAYSARRDLSGYLGAIRLPSETLWIEWNDRIRRTHQFSDPTAAMPAAEASAVSHAGVLISAAAGGRSGNLRTFWATEEADQEPQLAPVETLLDLDGMSGAGGVEEFFAGASVSVGDSRDATVRQLLSRASFRLDEAWGAYYRHAAGTAQVREAVASTLLGAAAHDVPVLMAFLLLLSVREAVVTRPVGFERLNAKRGRLGRRRLLAHVEVAMALPSLAYASAPGAGGLRVGPRLHHVRGHLVHRRGKVHWRLPHYRGHLRLGAVHSRTVTLGVAAAVLADCNARGSSQDVHDSGG